MAQYDPWSQALVFSTKLQSKKNDSSCIVDEKPRKKRWAVPSICDENGPPAAPFDDIPDPPRRFSTILDPWGDICRRRAADEPLCSSQKWTSPPDDIPRPKTDLSTLEPLSVETGGAVEGLKALICTEQAQFYLDGVRPAECAYDDLHQGMLGIGESEYSRTLTQYYNECLAIFCAYEKVEECAEKFDFYINEIRKKVLLPDYPLLKRVLRGLIWEAELRERTTKALRFKRELIFVTLLEGKEDYHNIKTIPVKPWSAHRMEEDDSPIATESGSINE
jgi:hypothetical protein